MKKIYLFFIILISALFFTPLCFADMVIAQNDGLERNTVNKGSLSCLKRKKEKLTVYKGANLRLKRGKLFKEKIPSGQNYFLSSESQVPTMEGSILGDCRDYIIIGSIGEGENKIALYYDVTEIPPESFLKYISDSQELEVYPPRNAKVEEETIEEEPAEEVAEGTTVNISDTLKALREAPKEDVNEDNPKPIVAKTTVVNGASVKTPIKQVQKTEQETEPVKKPKKNIFLMLSFAFFLTAFIEGIVTLLFYGIDWKMVTVVTVANLLTNPALNLIVFHYNITSNKTVLGFEIIITLIEFGIFAVYMRKDYLKLAALAVVANLASFLVGAYLVNMQFWWGAINKI